MAKKITSATASSHTHFGFEADPETGKIVGPGTNPDEIKFEGSPDGPCFVHAKNGQPIETIKDNATPQEGWFVRFGGTAEECGVFASR
jgi:hypothetical protein